MSNILFLLLSPEPFIWLFCLLLCDVLTLSNLQVTLALYLLLNSCTTEYLVLHEIFSHTWAVNYFPPHHLYLLYHNTYNKPYIAIQVQNDPSTFVYYLLSVKWNFVIILKNSGPAKTWPTRLSAMVLLVPAGPHMVAVVVRPIC